MVINGNIFEDHTNLLGEMAKGIPLEGKFHTNTGETNSKPDLDGVCGGGGLYLPCSLFLLVSVIIQ